MKTFLGVVIVGLLALNGCASQRSPSTASSGEADGPAWLWQAQPREYVLEVGDVFDLRLYYHSDLDDRGVVVRPDGKISAPLVGDVVARGRTPTQLAEDLRTSYLREGVKDPRVSVLLRRSAGLRVYVGGEVNTPGMVPHSGQLSLSRAVVQAGGPKNTASLRSVVLLRDSGKEEPLFAVIDMKTLLAGARDPLLQPYDIIFVPKSRIATLNQVIDQYIVKMIPVTLTAGFSYSIGRFKEIGK